MAKPFLPEPVDDGLKMSDVRAWSADKHHFLERYLSAFSTAMKDKNWDSLHYIDLFAGAGIERIEGKRLGWGSPLIAAQVPYPFKRLHLVELDSDKFSALQSRVKRMPLQQAPQLLLGDANDKVDIVVNAIPRGALSLAFLDPYGLHLEFETIRKLARLRVDLIVLFPDHMDALRNWNANYKDKPDSNLTRVLGTDEWEAAVVNMPSDQVAAYFTNLYRKQLASIGFVHHDSERISRSDGRHLYQLIFCSKSSMGLDIWRRVSQQKPGGQRSFDFL